MFAAFHEIIQIIHVPVSNVSRSYQKNIEKSIIEKSIPKGQQNQSISVFCWSLTLAILFELYLYRFLGETL